MQSLTKAIPAFQKTPIICKAFYRQKFLCVRCHMSYAHHKKCLKVYVKISNENYLYDGVMRTGNR